MTPKHSITFILSNFDNYAVDVCFFVFANKLNVLCPLARMKYRNTWISLSKTNIRLTFNLAHSWLLFCSIWTVDLAYLLQRFSVSFSYFTVTLGANPNYCLESFYKVIHSYTKTVTSSLMFLFVCSCIYLNYTFFICVWYIRNKCLVYSYWLFSASSLFCL